MLCLRATLCFRLMSSWIPQYACGGPMLRKRDGRAARAARAQRRPSRVGHAPGPDAQRRRARSRTGAGGRLGANPLRRTAV